jgi:hypothetical protein
MGRTIQARSVGRSNAPKRARIGRSDDDRVESKGMMTHQPYERGVAVGARQPRVVRLDWVTPDVAGWASSTGAHATGEYRSLGAIGSGSGMVPDTVSQPAWDAVSQEIEPWR